VGGDGGVFRRVGLVGLAILNGKRSYEGRGGGRGEKRKRAAKTERDTVGRQTEAEAETDRQTASRWWNVLLPAATAINLEAAGPCLRCSVDRRKVLCRK
jgi:hypothetical protein